MKYIDWNQASELGLILKINSEILHPLGLSISRNPETGFSESMIVADDGKFEYSEKLKAMMLSDDEIREKLAHIEKKES